MTLSQRTDHVTAALARLLTQYKDTNLVDYLTPFLTQLQELEDVFFDIRAILTNIEDQVGEQLDLLGRLVGQPREGRTDAVYILWIQARILVNKSSGLPDELLQVLRTLMANEISYEGSYPAGFVLQVFGILAEPEAVAEILTETRAGGVDGDLHYAIRADAAIFTFASGDTREASTTQGFADDSPVTKGGYFADALEV